MEADKSPAVKPSVLEGRPRSRDGSFSVRRDDEAWPRNKGPPEYPYGFQSLGFHRVEHNPIEYLLP